MTIFNIEDICFTIYSFFNFNDKQNIKFLNKTFYELWKKDLQIMKIIEKYVKKYARDYTDELFLIDLKYPRMFEFGFDIERLNNKCYRHNLYRKYMFQYKKKFLVKYPEYLINKAIVNGFNDIDKATKCYNWINNNLNKDFNKRTRLDILKFFTENEISVREIFYTGW